MDEGKRTGQEHRTAIESRKLFWTPEGRSDAVLKGLTLTFEAGHMYGIIGPNGSGKSSFLRHVMGFLKVQEGALEWLGKPVGEYRRRELAKTAAFVPQQTAIDTDFSAYEIVMTGRNPHQKRFQGTSAADRKKAEEALAFTDCSSLKDQPFASLSGGEAQRVIVSRAIAQEAAWMLLDEPIASLDIKNQVELMEGLKRLNQEKGISMVMVLHDLNLAAAYCDRLIMLKQGQVLFAGETKQGMTCDRLFELYGIRFLRAETEDGRPLFYPVYGKE